MTTQNGSHGQSQEDQQSDHKRIPVPPGEEPPEPIKDPPAEPQTPIDEGPKEPEKIAL